MTEQDKTQAQAVMFKDFARIEEIQFKIISLYESLGVLRQMKDEHDASFVKIESIIDLKIARLTHEKKELLDG